MISNKKKKILDRIIKICLDGNILNKQPSTYRIYTNEKVAKLYKELALKELVKEYVARL